MSWDWVHLFTRFPFPRGPQITSTASYSFVLITSAIMVQRFLFRHVSHAPLRRFLEFHDVSGSRSSLARWLPSLPPGFFLCLSPSWSRWRRGCLGRLSFVLPVLSFPWMQTSRRHLLACIAICSSCGLPMNFCPRTPPHPPLPSVGAFEFVSSIHDQGWFNSHVSLGRRECFSPARAHVCYQNVNTNDDTQAIPLH
ncbi:hypothetical protein PISMIDRAFT_240211 [Pisolithus microcarpus 441]|uniref:Uncharacterized protein n=1 Tax=Pisolithus microcarpus 441 TaxID=765257 RepID=A0A0C9YJW8_9AGAM|nr:hypothetical protein BKA83DRAFT_240211 [Pisolithus microcarpus]KIK16946.1 hypothetical protein PISMIDRAFT_240211 [Pisolithus microcarpus 441]